MQRVASKLVGSYRRLRTLAAVLVNALRHRKRWQFVVYHRRLITGLPASIALPLLCGNRKGTLRCPSDLTILLVHNHAHETIMEKSLRYVGINDFTVLRPAAEGAWRNTNKIREIKRYLDSGACRTEYVLYCDSRDAVLRNDPALAVRALHEADCGILFSNTRFDSGYVCMPEVRRWADDVAGQDGHQPSYINAGVFVARAEVLRRVMDEALEYVADDELATTEYRSLREEQRLCEALPEFPRRVGCDQVIMRYLHPKFFPEMKVDYRGRLALR